MQFNSEPNFAPSASPPPAFEWQRLMDTYVKLLLDLHNIQCRLGTGDERDADIQAAQELAHRIANLRTALTIWNDLLRLRGQQPQPGG